MNIFSLLTRARPWLIVLSILLAIEGQLALNEQSTPYGIFFFVLAVTALLVSLPELVATQIAPTTNAAHNVPRWWRLCFAIASAICTLFAFMLNADTSFTVGDVVEYQFTSGGVVAWSASILFFLAAFWEPEKNLAEWRAQIHTHIEHWRRGFDFHLSWTTIAILVVFAIGIGFYFYRLDATPAEMTSDHAEKLLDVNDILQGHTPLFFLRNTGREPIQFYLTVAVMQVFQVPLGFLALKIGTALIGWLAIPGTFLLAREMFDDDVAVFAAFFVAVMHWAVTIARMGLRYPFTPFFSAWSMYFFWRALKYGKRNDYLIAGLVMGVGLYGYIPSRTVPLVVLGLLVLWLMLDLQSLRDFASLTSLTLNIGAMYAMMLVVFAPLLRYSLDVPEMFWYRALTRVASTERAIDGNVFTILAQNIANLALAFNWRGEEVWVTNISYQPALDPVSGGLFVLGIAFAVYALVHYRAPNYLYLLAAFVALILPSALSIAFPRENPSFVRMGGAIPFVAILLALPLAVGARAVRRTMPNALGTLVNGLIFGVIALVIIALNAQWYFVDYHQSYRLSVQNSSEVAAVIHDFANSIGDTQHAFFIGYPYWLDGRAVAINLGDIHWENFTLDANDFLVAPTSNLLFILHPSDKDNLQKLQARYPQGQIKIERAWTAEKDFVAFLVPAK